MTHLHARQTLAAISLCASMFAHAAEPVAVAQPRPVLTVQVVLPTSASLERTVKANGSLAAWQEAIVGAEAQGLQISEVRAHVGDAVQRG